MAEKEPDSSNHHLHRHLKIVQLCAPAVVGGLESVVTGISLGLSARGHEVTVVAAVTPGHDPAPLLDPIASAGIRTLVLKLPGRAYLREWLTVGRFLDQSRPDLLHTHGYRSDILHGATARRKGIASVTTLHGFTPEGGLSGIGHRVQERMLRYFDGVIAVSRLISKSIECKGVPLDRIHYVPNAWRPTEGMLDRAEARRQLGLRPDGRTIAWIGRLVPIKGPDVFMHALSEIRSSEWTACVIGDGPERPAMEAIAHSSGVADQVRFAGLVQGAARYFAAFDLLVLSSRSEGTPIVVLEAMGAGIPVVATAVGGVSELLGGEAGGWLVPPGDPRALAEAVDHALSSPGAVQSRTRFGRARVESELSQTEWIARHEAVYHSAIRIRQRRRLSSSY